MKRLSNDRRLPGSTLLKIAPRLFSDGFVTAVVEPTIADLQSEVAAAGPQRMARLRARWRGYAAFWMLIAAAPFATSAVPAGDRAAGSAPGPTIVAIALVALVFIMASTFGMSVLGLAAAGSMFAVAIHAWYGRHPSSVPSPVERPWRSPQINFSSTEVPANMGGLIFVVGTLIIVAVALPWVLWFLLAAAVGGAVLAWRLAGWHARHPKKGLPENQIVLR